MVALERMAAPDGDPCDHPAMDDWLAQGSSHSSHEDVYDLLQRGQSLLRRRHPAQAATVLQRAANLEPRRGSILEPLGRAYFMSGQLDRAVETFEALLDVDPSNHFAHYALGRSLYRLGRAAEGRTHLRLAVALAPHSRLYRGGLERLSPEDGPRD